MKGRNRRTTETYWTLGAKVAAYWVKAKRNWLWIIMLPCLAGLGFGLDWTYWFLRNTWFFKLDQITVTGCRQSNPQEILKLSEVRTGMSIFDPDLDVVADKIWQNQWVRSVKVKRSYPRELKIIIAEHQPAVLVAMGNIYLADSDGNVFKRAAKMEETGFPVVTGITREEYINSGEHSRMKLREAISLIKLIWDRGVSANISEVHMDPVSGYTVFFSDGGMEVRFGKSGFDERAVVLKAVLDEADRRKLRPSAVFLDNEFRTDWVAMRLR